MPFTGCFESPTVVKEMALVKQIESPSGVTLEQGYHKISEGHLKWIENKRRWYLKYTVDTITTALLVSKERTGIHVRILDENQPNR